MIPGGGSTGEESRGRVGPRVKPVLAVLVSAGVEFEALLGDLREIWGPEESVTPPIPFRFTDYYAPEMGPGLERRLLSFQRLGRAETLPAWKQAAAKLEQAWARPGPNGGRRVNLDPGYLDYHRLVLASFKPGRHKIYLDRGVWADLTLLFERGAYRPLPWTFPDFRSGLYSEFLAGVRERFKQQIREGEGAGA